MYRADYFKVINIAGTNMVNDFTSTDLEEQGKLASMLLCGEYHQDIVDEKISRTVRHTSFKFYIFQKSVQSIICWGIQADI